MATRTAKKTAAPVEPKAPVAKPAPVVGRDSDHTDDSGGTAYHVSIKNGFSALFTANSMNEARQKYIKHFGIISTEHEIKVAEATDEQVAEDEARKNALENGVNKNEDGDTASSDEE